MQVGQNVALRVNHDSGQANAPGCIFWAEDALDDQFLIREAAKHLKPIPNIAFFGDGQALLNGLAHSKPDRIVLDIRMPRLDGIQSLKAIRQRPYLRNVPVVMFSTAMLSEEVELQGSRGRGPHGQSHGDSDQDDVLGVHLVHQSSAASHQGGPPSIDYAKFEDGDVLEIGVVERRTERGRN